MKYIVIGSNSFSGSDFIDMLLGDNNNKVIGISRSQEKSEVFLPYKTNKNIGNYQFFQGDINTDTSRILDIIKAFSPDYIVNFASQSEVAQSWDNPDHWYMTNCVGTTRLVKGLLSVNIDKYLHVGTPEVYGDCIGNVTEESIPNPSTPYAASRAATDTMFKLMNKQYGFPVVTIRSTNVYGSHQQLWKILPRTIIKAKLWKDNVSKDQIRLEGGGKQVRSYIHISDTSRAELVILERGRANEIYNVSPDSSISIYDLVHTVCDKLNVNFDEFTTMAPARAGNDNAYVIDSTKIRDKLGWIPIFSMEKCIEETIEWVERYWDEILKSDMNYIHKP
jgi:dTDP-glucose 4,6-dehydratase